MDMADLARDSELLLVAVSDRAIAEVAAAIPETEALIFHASGALLSLRDGFSLHPLKSLPPVGAASPISKERYSSSRASTARTAKLDRRRDGRAFLRGGSPKRRRCTTPPRSSDRTTWPPRSRSPQRLMARAGVDGRAARIWPRCASRPSRTGAASTTPGASPDPAARGDREVMDRHLEALRTKATTQVAEIYELLATEIADSLSGTGRRAQSAKMNHDARISAL